MAGLYYCRCHNGTKTHQLFPIRPHTVAPFGFPLSLFGSVIFSADYYLLASPFLTDSVVAEANEACANSVFRLLSLTGVYARGRAHRIQSCVRRLFALRQAFARRCVVPKSKEIQETMTTMAVTMEAAEMCEYKRKCEIIAEVIRFVQINDFVFLHRLCRFQKKMVDGACGPITNALGARR